VPTVAGVALFASVALKYAERTLRAVINPGRNGELFSYDENDQAFSLENPQ
jgi:hypothetical protein